MGGDTPEWQAFYALQRGRSNFRNSPAGQQLLSNFECKHESIKQKYQRIINLSRQILEIDAQILNKLDHELAEKSPDEEAMLSEAFHVKKNSRLGCQIPMDKELVGLKVELAPE